MFSIFPGLVDLLIPATLPMVFCWFILRHVTTDFLDSLDRSSAMAPVLGHDVNPTVDGR